MKRLLLGSLLSCMLVGQVFCAQRASEEEMKYSYAQYARNFYQPKFAQWSSQSNCYAQKLNETKKTECRDAQNFWSWLNNEEKDAISTGRIKHATPSIEHFIKLSGMSAFSSSEKVKNLFPTTDPNEIEDLCRTARALTQDMRDFASEMNRSNKDLPQALGIWTLIIGAFHSKDCTGLAKTIITAATLTSASWAARNRTFDNVDQDNDASNYEIYEKYKDVFNEDAITSWKKILLSDIYAIRRFIGPTGNYRWQERLFSSEFREQALRARVIAGAFQADSQEA